jgi:hypothetical protein
MVINLLSLPQETIDKYDFIKLSQHRKIHIELQKGMYGFPQAGILANELLQRNPTDSEHTWPMETQYSPNIIIVSSGFGVKYIVREHAEHLMECIKKTITFPATGKAVLTAA